MNWLLKIGIPKDFLSLKVHPSDKLAHYALACTDINFKYPFGCNELMGVAARGDYDLKQHSIGSGKSLEYFDAKLNVKYIPHVIEPSIGIDRLVLALLVSSYSVEVLSDNDKRVVLKLHPSVAPVKAMVFPLVSNNPDIVGKASDIYRRLSKTLNCEWDQSGAIGRRYRRADECGAVYCITVDFDSLIDEMVTIRDRDSMEQTRVKISDIENVLKSKLEF
jgi:glycyl-tRNA synthetase